MLSRRLLAVFAFLLVCDLVSCVSNTAYVIGQSYDETGPIIGLGRPLNRCLQAAVEQQNLIGGFPLGKNVSLIARDDKYNATITIENGIYFDQMGVIAFAGFLGTANSEWAVSYASSRSIAFVGPLSGASSMRKPYRVNAINLRASYSDEIAALVDFVLRIKDAKRFAVFYQDDPFGIDGRVNAEKILDKYFLKIVSEATYNKYLADVVHIQAALSILLNGQPDAIILVATRAAASLMIKEAKLLNRELIFLCVSVAVDDLFVSSMGVDTTNVFVSQIVPDSSNTPPALESHFRAAVLPFGAELINSQACREGYLVGRIVTEILRSLPLNEDATRASFISALLNRREFRFDGLSLGPIGSDVCDTATCGCNELMRKVYLSQIRGSQLTFIDYVFSYTTCGFRPMTPTRVVTRSVSNEGVIVLGIVWGVLLLLIVVVLWRGYAYLKSSFEKVFHKKKW